MSRANIELLLNGFGGRSPIAGRPNSYAAMSLPITALLRQTRASVGFPAVLLVLLAYSFLALVCIPTHAHGGHAAFETLRLPDDSPVFGAPAAHAQALQQSMPTQGPPRVAPAGRPQGAAHSSLQNSQLPQAVAILATWLHLALGDFAQPVISSARWDDAQLPGPILALWQRSVVLHL
jgi:hypothetical protein